jgi:uroporphyrin-3 C-methyltransferase
MTETDNSKKEPAKPEQATTTPSHGKSQAADQSRTNATTESIPNASKPKPDAPGTQPESIKPGSNTQARNTQTKKTSIANDAEHSKKESSKASPTAAKKPSTAKRPFPVTASIALVLAIVLALAVGAAGYLNYTRWQMADLQTQSLANENTKLRSQLGELQQQISGLQRQDLDFNLQEEQLSSELKLQNDSLNQLSQQFQALAADKGKDPMLWRVAEVEFLLSVANQQLILERDVNTALIALQDADRRLEAIGDPALIPVRKLIASESTALKSVDTPDIAGMALRLSALVDNIQQLPLVSRERTKTDVATDESPLVDNVNELMARIMKDLKGVVSIRRSDQAIEPLLPPEEQHYLAQNLGLKLEEARIALLRHDTETFRQNLSDVQMWVQRYFDPKSAAVTNVIATVDDLRNAELKPELPDISGSLRELRRWLSLQQQRNTSVVPSRQSQSAIKANRGSNPESNPDSDTATEPPAPEQRKEENI